MSILPPLRGWLTWLKPVPTVQLFKMFSLNKQTSKALEVTAGYAQANILIKRKQQQGRWSLAAGMPVGMQLINVVCNSLSVSPSSWCQQAALSAASSRPSKADFSIFLGKSTHVTQAHFVRLLPVCFDTLDWHKCGSHPSTKTHLTIYQNQWKKKCVNANRLFPR